MYGCMPQSVTGVCYFYEPPEACRMGGFARFKMLGITSFGLTWWHIRSPRLTTRWYLKCVLVLPHAPSFPSSQTVPTQDSVCKHHCSCAYIVSPRHLPGLDPVLHLSIPESPLPCWPNWPCSLIAAWVPISTYLECSTMQTLTQ